MKTIILSIKPKYVELIFSGKKKVEVRKSMLQTPFKVLIYCTKDKKATFFNNWHRCNGKVVGEFTCNGIIDHINPIMQKLSCLTFDELIEYQGKAKTLYGWRISDLKIYDKPKELSQYKHRCKDNCLHCSYGDMSRMECSRTVTHAPQSWYYVEE